ncbi:MAG: DUF1080 domain-containing protein [Fimbriimonadaceae bacterium]|nr:DUF1080 domain-containing protein [Chthonomonadaceae bacterium]MCO5296979.1 DUF1080 domain-containing protein [Fimbriimonadaceae bacterium]
MLAALLFFASADKIFDGKTLNGWEVVGGGQWTVDGGVLKGHCAQADEQGVLIYEKPVRDFEANLEFRISGGNSGFYFRAERIKEQPLVKGFQAEIDAIEDVGGIWETAGRGWVFKPNAEVHAKAKFTPGQWTKMEVSAVGSHYTVRLNGATITDIDDPQGRKEGVVALQLHGGMDMTVEFRNIYLTRRN